MSDNQLRRWTGLLLIITPIAFTVCFTLLQIQFNYPTILRAPTEEVMRLFVAGGPVLVLTWYTITLTALLFVPAVVLAHQLLTRAGAPSWLWLATTFGVIAGLVQTLGFIRWPFLVPYLADAYLAPGATQVQRETIDIVFQAFNRYAGMAVGENLGYLCTGVWTILFALALQRVSLIRPWLGIVGIILAVGILVGLLEPAGWELAGTINAVCYLLWAVWLVVVGVMLLRRHQ